MESKNYERAFAFVNLKQLPPKPRRTGLIEIRGPYYEAFTTTQLKDLLNTWGYYIDGFKFAGGTQALLDKKTVKSFTNLAHEHQVYVNTGGFIERILIQDVSLIDEYLEETKQLGFDVVEISSGMFQHPNDFSLADQIKLVKTIEKKGLKAKPEITIMSGVGGGVKEIGYQQQVKATKTKAQLLEEAERFFDAGAFMLMVESEGITEGIKDVNDWRSDIIFSLIERFGHEKLMFEVSPEDDEARQTFKWYLKNVSLEINLMMNAKNIVEFNAWRLHLWGDRDMWNNKKINLTGNS
ncbi:phosphosulfolactate synthase [Legionella jamestowniensis]|uniref:(2R)-phospho-3-sulfolactate synthase (ComA) n=1 Tax=Legionella jamestowniensis TaxID=455 RepID=A0A0W0UL67_9GAMM|nr:phosphosulfolactate synthase [Legionella jamestowniensis]KTD08612.1 (2R)-phospho-3-sulfolactate synthase (ComA) [Legionella jamestowniensis]OCH96941.1 phosphosulfolactate synthase [Legionella jamestowniensis]SFL53580.1 phosphosulfolactate synthase [Legionella jamestowniensis DSM 19215]